WASNWSRVYRGRSCGATTSRPLSTARPTSAPGRRCSISSTGGGTASMTEPPTLRSLVTCTPPPWLYSNITLVSFGCSVSARGDCSDREPASLMPLHLRRAHRGRSRSRRVRCRGRWRLLHPHQRDAIAVHPENRVAPAAEVDVLALDRNRAELE